MSEHRIRLLIVDDHPVFREALAHALATTDGLDVVAQANCGEDALILWQRHRPDVTIMDVSMGGMDGIETMRRILSAGPDARVLMLTSSNERADARQALEAGASGYITKNAALAALVAAIREVHAGGRPIGDDVARGLAVTDAPPLSPREIEVLRLLRDGLSQDQISRKLVIADRTVRAHVAAIKEKLGAASTAHCVTRGFELGILGSR
jgi:DNA-binding NarL/FixJ family response regulator